MKLYLGLILLGLAAVTFSEGIWVWDGSYLFFKAMDIQHVYVHHSRLIMMPPQAAILLANHFTDNFILLSWLFSAVYVSFVLAPLIACAWMLPKEQFIWVALGYSSTTLAGQFPLYSESMLTTQFFWAVLAALLTDHPRIAYFFAALMLISHPAAVLFFGLAVLIAKNRPVWLAWLGLSILRFALLKTAYETERLSLEIFWGDFQTSVWGLPFWAIGISYILPFIKSDKLKIAGLLLAGLLWFSWARDVRLWAGSFGYRAWSPLLTLPLMFFMIGPQPFITYGRKFRAYPRLQNFFNKGALAPWFRSISGSQGVETPCYQVMPHQKFPLASGGRFLARILQNSNHMHSSIILNLCGLIFALTLFAQSWAWWQLRADFRAVLADAPSCLPYDPNTVLNENGLRLGETPLSHWSITVYSILQQGREADKIWLYDRACENVRADNLAITFWETRSDGWFEIQP